METYIIQENPEWAKENGIKNKYLKLETNTELSKKYQYSKVSGIKKSEL